MAVVADGQRLFARGYGHADLARRREVAADRTLFRVGSISKLFVWTAVMQLVERGRLDLNPDLNRYLPTLPIPATFPQPITMTHLMTHRAGFQDHFIGLYLRGAGELRPLGAVLVDDLPARVRPPGELAASSNHGTALAAYFVEQVAGVGFDEYVEREILRPLGMERSTFRQPVPAALEQDLAVGYRFRNGEHQAQDFEFIPLPPAGSMSTTATDMARFMVAHLQHGRLGSTRILSEQTARRMHSRIFGHDPRLNGMLHGFYELSHNGQRVFGHGGDTMWFHSELALLPERNVGVFLSYNSDTGGAARTQALSAFLDHYYPAPPPRAAGPIPGFRQRAAALAGAYASLRRSYTSLTKIVVLLRPVEVKPVRGVIETTGLGRQPRRWEEVVPFVFREVAGPDRLIFRTDGQGRVTHLLRDDPTVAFSRLPPAESPALQGAVPGACALVLLSALVAWPVAAWRQRRQGKGVQARREHLCAWLMSALLLGALAGLAAILSDFKVVLGGIPPHLKAVLALPPVAARLALGALAGAARAWRRGSWGLAGRLHYSAAAALVLLGWLSHWNLLGWRFH